MKPSPEELQALKLIIGREISRHRKHKKIRQYMVAREMGAYQSTICRLEHGKNWPTIRYLARTLAVLGVSMKDFFQEVDKEMTRWRQQNHADPSKASESDSSSLLTGPQP